MVNDYWQPYAERDAEPFGPPLPGARTNGYAIAALACGIVGFPLFPVAIAAVVFGHIARRQIRETRERGSGMATAGLMLGYIGTVIGILLIIAFICAFLALASFS